MTSHAEGSTRKSIRPPSVREPLQDRSREAWQRILDAGVVVLAEMGVRGFTVAKVCERAGVSVTAVYSRLDSRDDLLAAAYEHGIATVRQSGLELTAISEGPPDARAAVAVLEDDFRTHGPFIRATVLGSVESAYISARGAQNVAGLRALFIDAAAGSAASAEHKAIAAAYFAAIFSVLALSVAFGEEFIHGEREAEPVGALGTALAQALGQ